MPIKNPDMFDTFVEIDGINLFVDPINRTRTKDGDNVFAILTEEQPFTWKFVQPYIKKALKESDGEIDFLDVGCGSGVFGLLMAKHYSAKVVAVDLSKRAIEFAKKNAELNNLEITLRHEYYNLGSVPEKQVKIIGIYPPYHIYPSKVRDKLPQHACGGSDGQGEFRNQLCIADYHLANNGIIFFNQFCLGDKKGPNFLNYIKYLVRGNVSLVYTNVFGPIDTKEFLDKVYQDKHRDFVNYISDENPLLYYTVGIITRDNKGLVAEMKHNLDLKGRTWNDRIQAHYEIVKHEQN